MLRIGADYNSPAIWLCLLVMSVRVTALEAPAFVLTSNHPLALLAAPLFPSSDQFELAVLLPPNTSQHHPSLRLSDRALLEEAAAIVWLGERLEPGLAEYVARLPAERTIEVAPSQLLGQVREHDPHVWLNPELAVDINRKILEALGSRKLLSPGVDEAAREFGRRLEILAVEYREKIRKLPFPYYITVHDTFGHLADYLGIEQLGYLVDAEDQPVGLRSLWKLERKLPGDMNICVLSSPGYARQHQELLAGMTDFHEYEVDTLGAGFPIGKDSFLVYMRAVLETLYQCLQENRSGE